MSDFKSWGTVHFATGIIEPESQLRVEHLISVFLFSCFLEHSEVLGLKVNSLLGYCICFTVMHGKDV